MSKVKTSIVDRNGKATHVWKNVDVPGGNKSFDRLGNVTSQFVPIANEQSESSFNGVILTGTEVHLAAKDGRMIPLSIPEVGAILNKMQEYPSEWGAPNSDTTFPISNDIVAGWRNKTFIIEDKIVGEISLDASEEYLLASNLALYMSTARDISGWSDTHGLVDIVRSGVSDRDENYFITLGPEAMITTYIQDSGLADGDFGYNDRDSITLYRDAKDPDTLSLQISYTDDVDIAEYIDGLDEGEYDTFVDDLNTALKEVDPRLVANFDSPESVEILFSDTSNALQGDIDPIHNTMEFTTSNVLNPYSQPEHLAMMDQAWGVFRSKVDY